MGEINAMTIAIDASRALYQQPTGIELYSREIVRALLALPAASAYRWRLLTPAAPPSDHPLADLPPHAAWQIIPGRRAWTLYRLSQYFHSSETSKYTLFVPGHTLPLICPARSVVTIHDLAFRYFPESYGWWRARWIDHELRRSVRKAAAVITPSQATANDIIKFYGAPREKIHVIHHGADHLAHRKLHIVSARGGARDAENYMVYIGRIEPRKNVPRLLAAYALALKQQPDLPDLRLIGRPGWGGRRIMAANRQFPPDVRRKISFLGYQSPVQTADQLGGATALLYPSLYEGFGFPVLEAMAAGVPVLTSNRSSLPEITGDAALLVNPTDTAAITAGILKLNRDNVLRRKLAAAGRERVRQFAWERAARATLNVLKNL